MTPATKRRLLAYGIAIGLIAADAAVTAIVKALTGADIGLPATTVAIIGAVGAAVESDIRTAEQQHPIPVQPAPVTPPTPPAGA